MSPSIRKLAHMTVVATMVCGVAACATGKTDAQRQEDREIADRVETALSADRELYARHIHVQVNNGVAHLGGYVWTEPDMQEAVRIAELVDGVHRVVDDLELELNGIDNSNVGR